jgi:predicted nucleic acid-binding protein
MKDKVFFDTNTLIYILEGKDAASGGLLSAAEMESNRKGDITLRLLESGDIFVGVQVFNELCNVALRNKFNWAKTRVMLSTLEALCTEVVPLTLAVHKRGVVLHDRYGFQFHDCLMLAAALEARCLTFYSEDMQDGQVIESTMTVKNPFKV